MTSATITVRDVDEDSVMVEVEFDPPVDQYSEDEVPYTHMAAAVAARFLMQVLSEESPFEGLAISHPDEEPTPAFDVSLSLKDEDLD